MGNSRGSLISLNLVLTSLVIFSSQTVNSQINTPCTRSMITSFTPCFNFITGSSRNGSSPVKDCCNSLRSLLHSSMDCACLVITGNVPFSIPFARNLAISLPRMCNGAVPIQCKPSGVPLPAPGPVLFGPRKPAPAAFAPVPKPRVAKVITMAPPPDKTSQEMTPVPSPVLALAPTGHSKIKPVLIANSASNLSCVLSPTFLLIILTLVIVFDFY